MNEAINQVEVVRQEILPIPEEAKRIIIKDQTSLARANLLFLQIKILRKKIDDTFSPIIQAAHKTHQEAIAQRKLVEEPLIIAEKYLNGQVTDYKREQDRLRAEEEEKNRQEAIKIEAERRQKEEDDRLAQAAILEASGAKEEAEALVSEAIEEKERPLEVYVPPPETPKVELNGASVRGTWTFEIEKESLNPKAISYSRCKKDWRSGSSTER